MTWRDKLEIGLKEDARFRKDNLPADQVRGPEVSSGPGRSPVIPAAREDEKRVPPVEDVVDNPVTTPRKRKRKHTT